jgi:hypothetical protein
MVNVMSVGITNLMLNETECGRDDDDLFNIEKSSLNATLFFSLLQYE